MMIFNLLINWLCSFLATYGLKSPSLWRNRGTVLNHGAKKPDCFILLKNQLNEVYNGLDPQLKEGFLRPSDGRFHSFEDFLFIGNSPEYAMITIIAV